MLKVSVVVPVYDPGEYFRPCIDSLTSQTMSSDEYEIICIDDGSTDETPALLDELAETHANLQVIHQPNSGWPGHPRNVGLDVAQGEYVFFCDHDDWLGTEALERLYDFATSCDSDVVLPKMAGLQRRFPRVVFAQTIRSCTVTDSSIMDSLTPHKLFRREFLNQHHIRFPEGKRRLEDHHFVVTSYLLAKVVSIYADYTCYFHIRRLDSANAGFRKTNWRGYFDNLADALDVVVAHTDPGEERDRIFRRWLQVEMVQRLSGRRWLKFADEEAAALFSNAHRIASRYFGEGVVELLQPMQQRIARALLAGDAAEVRRIAEQAAPWATYPRVLQVDWVDGRLHIGGTVQLSDVIPQGWTADPDADEAAEVPAVHESAANEVEGETSEEPPIATRVVKAENDVVEEAETIFADMPDEPLAEQRFAALLDHPAPEVLWLGMATSPIRVDLTERRTGETWPVRAGVQRMGLAASFTAAIDPNTIAAGTRLHDGLWDVNVHFGVLGLGMRRRATLTKERQPGNVLPEPVTEISPTMAAYFTRRTSGLCLDVGLVRHPKLRIGPKPAVPAKKFSFSRRAVRKVRRLLARARHLRSPGTPGRGREARPL
ncbi:MAG TPA: glycosyltransferase [Propionibacteriaceae bacterium]|nr:glycosyltransferase [Propionibacteriaceae bacterium]